jgi:hypothetical protein
MKKLLLIIILVLSLSGSAFGATYYLDYANGDDGNDGSDWANAKKTLRGAAGLCSAGDTVRIAKSDDPTAIATDCTFTVDSTSVTTDADLTGDLSTGDYIKLDNDSEDMWWKIASITSDTITLSENYYGDGGEDNITKMNPITGVTQDSFNQSGSSGNVITLSGGWNTSTTVQDGKTYWKANVSGEGTGLPINASYIDAEGIGVIDFNRGISLGGYNYINISDLEIYHADDRAVYTIGGSGRVFTDLKISGCVNGITGDNLPASNEEPDNYSGTCLYSSQNVPANEYNRITNNCKVRNGDRSVSVAPYPIKGIDSQYNGWGIYANRNGIIYDSTFDNNDIDVYVDGMVFMYNCSLDSSTQVASQGGMTDTVTAINLGGVDSNHKFWFGGGDIISTGAGLTDETVRTAGSLAMRFAVDGDVYFNFSSPVMVVKDQEVTVSLWVRKNSTYDNRMLPKIELFGFGLDDSDQMTDVDDTWEELTVSGTPTISGEASLNIILGNTAAGGYVYLDDITVEGGAESQIGSLDFWSAFTGVKIPTLNSVTGGGEHSFGFAN